MKACGCLDVLFISELLNTEALFAVVRHR